MFFKINLVNEIFPGLYSIITLSFSKSILFPIFLTVLEDVEANKKLAEYLSNIKDERLIVFNDCASNVKKILKKCNQDKVDYVVSGIPFSFFDEQFTHSLLSDSKELISDNGKFLAYQVSLKLKKPLKKHFKEVNTELQPLNIPPLFIFEAEK
jgi:phospholipid N-methyltransferase